VTWNMKRIPVFTHKTPPNRVRTTSNVEASLGKDFPGLNPLQLHSFLDFSTMSSTGGRSQIKRTGSRSRSREDEIERFEA
jgi:hypothetical protein